MKKHLKGMDRSNKTKEQCKEEIGRRIMNQERRN
jgi:hypothetical protein